MRTPIAISLALTLVAAPAALAKKPDNKKDKKPPKTSPYSCVPKNVGLNVRGTLVSGSITQSAGADTPQRGDDRYSGDVTVNVTKANHNNSPKGEQSFTLTNVRAKFHPRNDTAIAAGDRIKLSGKTTKVGKKCADAFTPTVTVRKVDVKAAKAPKPKPV